MILEISESVRFWFLIDKGGFERYIVLGIQNGRRWIRVTDTYGNQLYHNDQTLGCMMVFFDTAMGMKFSEKLSQAACASEA